MALAQHPFATKKVLIAFNQGFVLYNYEKCKAEKVFTSNLQMKSMEMSHNGIKYLESHGDGYIYVWTLEDGGFGSTLQKDEASWTCTV